MTTDSSSTSASKNSNEWNDTEPSQLGESTTTITATHYTNHDAVSYENAFFYEPGMYMEHLTKLVQNRFGLLGDSNNNSTSSSSSNCITDETSSSSSSSIISTSSRTSSKLRKRLLDIGGGTGNFTKQIINGMNIDAIVVDPFLEESTTTEVAAVANTSITFVKEPAEAFLYDQQDNSLSNTTTTNSSLWRTNYDYVLLKEVVHHLHEKDRVNIFRGIYNGFTNITPNDTNQSSSASILLIITRPQHDIDYPLWDEARIVWAKSQPSTEQLVQELDQAGYNNITTTIESYPCSIPIQRWQQMIQQRFWSTFATFTDDELKQACQSIVSNETSRIDTNGIIHFDDRLVFITATT